MAEKLFIDGVTPSDKLYCIIRDEERCVHYKSYMEDLWGTYKRYADKDFPQQLAQDFHARFWEMYLTCTLIFKSFSVVPKQTRSQGPDILIDDSSTKIFLEAITPSEGAIDNPDKVRQLEVNTFKATPVPDTEITLRYSSAVADKYKKYLTYLEQGIVSLSDSYVIALNSCKIETAIIDMTGTSDLPRIVKAVLPIGYKEVTISKSSGSTVDWHYQYRPKITRASGSDVPTDLFLRDDYAGISGVLYSHSDIANRHDDFIFIHNPKSTQNAIPHEYFKLGIEYFIELGQQDFSVSWKDWRNKS